ncbi:MAG: hypothetical protein J5879_01545 [Clostridia bacterium]|nr:hypothetical protein [Clostridia bacterium]
MAIREFTENVNIISALPDVPAPPEYNAAALKAKFDEAAVKIKAYINGSLLPDIENMSVSGVAAVRKLAASYTTAGTFRFEPSAHPSVGSVYDIVLIGGGGGGSIDHSLALGTATGGGAGAVTKETGLTLSAEYYNVTVGAAGVSDIDAGTDGGATYAVASDFSLIKTAAGGKASSQNCKIGKGGGIGGGDSVYGDGTVSYGHGGDNEYGRGVRGAVISDDTERAQGYGAGGWAAFAPTCGAVFIYGYERI